MHPGKAPGPDGLAPCFYQTFWSIVGEDVTAAVRTFVGSRHHLKQLNHTNVTLIPKIKTPELVSQLRPISLCNVLYRIGSKVLANRLKPLLENLISQTQSAFLPGRLISDNSLMAFEISHYLKRLRSKGSGYCALKLDMSKAYDRVEWRFLEVVMESFGFCREWIRWIMAAVETVSYSFILDGEPRGRLYPERGIRQGDAISPYLFLLCAEVFSKLLERAEQQQKLHGVRICSRAPCITHLFFADDSFVFFKAEVEECRAVKDILDTYAMVSGQEINFQKSCISFSKNVDLDFQFELAEELGVTRVHKHDKYLGLPTEVSYSKDEAFRFLTEKMDKKAHGWRDKVLSLAGKEILIKAVLQSIPMYVMSCFELPQHLCSVMHQIMAKIWWGDKSDEKKIHWLAWRKMCSPKREGGMGFKDMQCFNKALLAKQGWRLMQRPNSLAARMMKAKYFPDSSFMEATLGNNASFAWRSILSGRRVLEVGGRYRIGDGSSVSLWFDPWIPLPHSFRPFSQPMSGTEDWSVSDIIDQEDREWIMPVLEDLFTKEEVELIASIPLSRVPRPDRFIWHYNKNGVYSVRSGYYAIWNAANHDHRASSSRRSGNPKDKFWNKIWGAHVPPKVRVFGWRLARDILPTRAALMRKVQLPSPKCCFYHIEVETSLHLFKDCPVAQCVWACSPVQLRSAAYPGMSISDWMMYVIESLDSHRIDLFLVTLWALWCERNNICWKGGTCDPFNMTCWALKLLEDYQKVHPTSTVTKKKRRQVKWKCPLRGRLKVNVDGAYLAKEQRGGIGVVVRDEHGHCVAALTKPVPYASSVMQVEAEAVRAGMLVAIHQQCGEIELESDCALVLSAISASQEDLSEVGSII